MKDGKVLTHPADELILDGITRQVVLELCQRLGLEVGLEGIPATSIPDMDEAFLTGTSTQVLAIQSIDGYRLFEVEPGPVTQKLQRAFLKLKQS